MTHGGTSRWSALWAIVLGLTGSVHAFAASAEIGPNDDLRAALSSLAPGDTLVLRGGTYDVTNFRLGLTLIGTSSRPITIRAKAGERPHIRRTNASQNILDVDRAEYVTIRGIEFSGGSRGVRIVSASHFTVEDCEIHDTGDVAISANHSGQTYDSLRILRNHIHDTNGTGEGLYLGCNSDDCRVLNSLIHGNYIHHTNNPQTVSQGDGIELKEGSANNTIADNVIHDTNYPCILTYATRGRGAQNTIERNFMFRCGDHAIQSAQDSVIRNNIVLGAQGDGIALQPHQAGAPGNQRVVHNTILDVDGTAISIRNPTGAVVVANNALFTTGGNAIQIIGGQSFVTVAGNVVAGSVSGTSTGYTTGLLSRDFVAAQFGAPPSDVFPRTGSALIGSADARYVAADDFNQTVRGSARDVGAYLFSVSGNPGWVLAAAPKPAQADPPPAPDAGIAADAPFVADAPSQADAPSRADAQRQDDARGNFDAGLPDARRDSSDVSSAADAIDSDANTAPDAAGESKAKGCACRSRCGRPQGSLSGLAIAANAMIVYRCFGRMKRGRKAR